MKLNNYLLILLFANLNTGLSQINTEPVAPPVPPVKNTTTHTTTSDSFSFSSNEDGETKAVSINNTSNSYQLKANFNSKDIYDDLKALLLGEMSQSNLRKDNENYTWKVKSNKDVVYQVSLSRKNLNVNANKKLASPALVQKIQDLGLIARDIVRGEENNDLEQMQRDAERMLRDAERMKREAERLLEISNRDAERMHNEAERLALLGEKLEKETEHMGAFNSIIEKLLADDATRYVVPSENNGWVWPAFQAALINQLIIEKLIKNENHISLSQDDTGIYVNGSKMSKSQINNFNALRTKHGIGKENSFSFRKSDNNIVITNNNPEVEAFFEAIKDAGFVTDLSKKVFLKINGAQILVNNKILNSKETTLCNKLLLQNKIISAPNKIIEFIPSGTYRLGYNVGKNTTIGTYINLN